MLRARAGLDGRKAASGGGGDAGTKKEKAKDRTRSPEGRAWPPGGGAWPLKGGARPPGMGTRLPEGGPRPSQFSSVQFSRSVVSDSLRPQGLKHTGPPCPSSSSSRSLLKLMSIESVKPSNHLILCGLLLLLASVFPSIRVFSNELALHIRWPKYWSFSFRINPSSEYSGLISFRMDWLDLLTVQGTLKSLL